MGTAKHNESQSSSYPKPPFPKQGIDPPGVEEDMHPKPRYKGEAYQAAGKLKDKVAIITGGDSGIGRSVAYHFAREGAKVAICYLPAEQRDAYTLQMEIAEIEGECLAIEGDLRDAEFCEDFTEQVVSHFGHLDILVNNAAYQNHVDSIDELSVEQWKRTFETNIYPYFYMLKCALKHLPKGGVVINTGSITGLEGSKGLLDYSSTKGAIHAFTKSAAQALADKGIRVNCVAPGPVWTPLNPAERSLSEVRSFGEKVPFGRPAQPEEIAPAYVYFASNADSQYVTGEILTLLGGETRAG